MKIKLIDPGLVPWKFAKVIAAVCLDQGAFDDEGIDITITSKMVKNLPDGPIPGFLCLVEL